MSKRPEWKSVAPWSTALSGVGSQLKYIIRVELKAFNDGRRAGGVSGVVIKRICPLVVEDLIEDNLPVSMALCGWIPLQPNACRTEADCGEVLRGTSWN